MKYLFIIGLILTCSTSNAQLSGLLKKAKENLEKKASDKIEQKMNQGIDSAVNTPEKVIKKGKKEQKVATARNQPEVTMEDLKASSDFSLNGDGKQMVIRTNILCESGRKKAEAALAARDGVFEVKTDTKTGELHIRYSSDGTSRIALLGLINELGFEADGTKPAEGAPANPCKS